MTAEWYTPTGAGNVPQRAILAAVTRWLRPSLLRRQSHGNRLLADGLDVQSPRLGGRQRHHVLTTDALVSTTLHGLEREPADRVGTVLEVDRAPVGVTQQPADRLITLPLSEDRSFGIFDSLPDDYTSASEFAEDLMRAASANHGHAMRRFVKKLVKARIANEPGLQSEIRAFIHEFREKAGINSNNGSDVRVADAFGLVYAAGELAQRFGALPKELRPAAAALWCYQMHRAYMEAEYKPFSKRLANIASGKRVIRVKRKGPVPKGYLGYIRKSGSQLELLVPTASMVSLFPDWDQIKKSHEVRCALKMDGSHLTTKRKLSAKPERVYCFAVPPEATESE